MAKIDAHETFKARLIALLCGSGVLPESHSGMPASTCLGRARELRTRANSGPFGLRFRTALAEWSVAPRQARS